MITDPQPIIAAAATYAVLVLDTLAVKRFANADELRAAMDWLHANGKQWIVLKHHPEAGIYAVQQTVQ